MDLSQANRILHDQKSSKLERLIAENELRRLGFFQTLTPHFLPEKMFIEIKANPNILMKEKNAREYEPLVNDFFYNLIYVFRFRFFKSDDFRDQREIPQNSLGISLYAYDLSEPRLVEFSFLFLENYFECLRNFQKRVPDYVSAFAKDREFESGLKVYEQVEKTLRSQIIMP